MDLKKFIKEEVLKIYKEDIDDVSLNVDECYRDILSLLQKYARQLSDDDAYALHERLKSFFNRAI